MMRRGSRFSRGLAALVVGAPLALVMAWSLRGWWVDGQRIAAAELALHQAGIRSEHAELYRSLGEVWEEYASADVSGLRLDETPDQTVAATQARLRQVFERFGGAATAVVALERRAEDGLLQFRLEARGGLPEAGLPQFLAALESEPPLLFVDMIDIRRMGDTKLSLRLRVSTFRLTEGQG